MFGGLCVWARCWGIRIQFCFHSIRDRSSFESLFSNRFFRKSFSPRRTSTAPSPKAVGDVDSTCSSPQVLVKNGAGVSPSDGLQSADLGPPSPSDTCGNSSTRSCYNNSVNRSMQSPERSMSRNGGVMCSSELDQHRERQLNRTEKQDNNVNQRSGSITNSSSSSTGYMNDAHLSSITTQKSNNSSAASASPKKKASDWLLQNPAMCSVRKDAMTGDVRNISLPPSPRSENTINNDNQIRFG